MTAQQQRQRTDRDQAASPPRRGLPGVVERTTYANADNGCTIARLAPERPEREVAAAQGGDWPVTIVGTLADLTSGKAIVAAFPAARTARGPHGIPLLDHARAGGPDAVAVIAFLDAPD